MSRLVKLYMRVASAPGKARFEDVVHLAEAVGFVLVRRRGSHQMFCHADRPSLALNLQPVGGKAKSYQVKDLLEKIERERLWRW
jgi:predicted RNA binding protein YcfA (HicA-like mRNA interferase family)